MTSELSKQRNDAITNLTSAIFLGTGNCSYKIVHGSFFLQYGRLGVLEVKAESVRTLSRYFGMKFLSLEIR